MTFIENKLKELYIDLSEPYNLLLLSKSIHIYISI